MSYLIFFNLAVLSAVVFYITRTVKKSFQYEVAQIVGFFRGTRVPPGPLGLPFLGSIPCVAGTDGYTPFSQLATEYGGMAYFKLGKKKILVMREPAMIKEAYRLVAFSDRPKTSFKDDGLIGNKGIIQSVGNVWSEHRRLILSAFRTIGLKSAASAATTPQTAQIAEKMQHDVQEYLSFVQQHVVQTQANQSSNQSSSGTLEQLTGRLAGSGVSSCVLGLPRSFGDRDFAENVAVIEEGFHVGEKLAPFEVMPILKRVPGMWRKVQEKMQRNHCVTCKYFTGLIREKVTQVGGSSDTSVQPDCQSSSSPDSLITIYRQEMSKPRAATGLDAVPVILSELQLMQTMTDIFCAATETVKYSLMWMMLYMAKYPKIQEKIQAEIGSLSLSEDELISWNDLAQLPYTEATILECMRLRPVLPFGHPRAVHDAGAEFHGYNIPKGTVVLALIWDIHQDPRFFENPLQFRPSRFINAEGQTFRPENFIPFGTGRRMCLGDQMAMMQLFTAFSGLLKRYTIAPKASLPVDLSWKILLSLLIPSNFQVDLIPRSATDHTSHVKPQHSM